MMVVATRSTPRWRKILYEKQPFPDNYCGPEFMQGLRTNVTARKYGFFESVSNACVVMLHIDGAVLFVCIYCFLYMRVLDSTHLLTFTCTIAAVSYLSALKYFKGSAAHQFPISPVRDCKLCVIFIGFGSGLSPVFKSLTETISTDTIYAMVSVMLFVNIFFNDYGVDAFVVSRPLSLNGAIFASVCLASRLETSFDCFTLLSQAMFVFVVWPFLIPRIKQSNLLLFVSIISFTTVIALCLYILSTTCLFLYIGLDLFVSMLCPLLLMKLQAWKSTIHGPWDEAVIIEDDL